MLYVLSIILWIGYYIFLYYFPELYQANLSRIVIPWMEKDNARRLAQRD